jgi:hypothetical protein
MSDLHISEIQIIPVKPKDGLVKDYKSGAQELRFERGDCEKTMRAGRLLSAKEK